MEYGVGKILSTSFSGFSLASSSIPPVYMNNQMLIALGLADRLVQHGIYQVRIGAGTNHPDHRRTVQTVDDGR